MCSPLKPPKLEWYKLLHTSGDGSKGLAGRSCHVSACLHLLCRTSSHLYSRHRQAVAWQPSLRDSRQWETALTHQQLQPRVTLDLRRPVSNQAAYCNPPRVKPTLPIKYNKTHCWNFYCASYSTLFLGVLINSLTVSFIYTQLCGTIVCFVLPSTSQA